ncbi:MAG: 2OG-Fe(II) oxygenase [Sphingomicrobium sp.]
MRAPGASALFQQAAAIARAGRPEDGVRFIETAADDGDPDANFIVAHWLLYGTDRPRDAVAARRRLEAAASTGSGEALRTLAHLTAAGTGCDANPQKAIELLRQAADSDSIAARELALLPAMMGEKAAETTERELVSADPHIEIVRRLLLPEECAWLIARAEPLLKPSFVDDGKTGIGRPEPIRTSHGAAFVPHEADLVVQRIARRVAAAAGTPPEHSEALYVMRYAPGQQYRPHLDWLPGLKNQREWTAIAYLNDAFEGGATAFPELGLSLRLGPGDLIVFRNSDSAQQADQRMIHAGEPVTAGEKWIATLWIRHRPHDPYDRD